MEDHLAWQLPPPWAIRGLGACGHGSLVQIQILVLLLSSCVPGQVLAPLGSAPCL